ALNGTVYQALGDGSVKIAPDDETVPFSSVTFFDADIRKEHVSAASIGELRGLLDGVVEEHGKNQFYMVKVTGLMPSILVRSVLKQKEPYKPLNDVVKTDQREFTCSDIRGTVVALYCPDYMDGLNAAGWHMHFISEDGRKGGHVLALSLQDGTLELDVISSFAMLLPDRASFNSKNLAMDMKKEIEQVEGK
ncbi:MAG: acetolactate decarboxylase, partial [Fretibacterium sp.]|nr:acetolactate decarboxylase [Fretibacterium sp.]